MISVDTSDLDNLIDQLGAAINRTPKERAAALRRAGDATEAGARANVASYTAASTGELLSTITHHGTDLQRQVGSTVKQAALLEYGTPTTGAPRPWLTGPAESALDDLLSDLASAAEPW